MVFKKGQQAHNKGKPMTEEQIKKSSLGHKGQKAWNKGTKGLMGKGRTGSYPTEETRKKLSESHKGKPNNRLGRKHSEKSKKKMSEGLRGHTAWNKGKHFEAVSGDKCHLWKGGITKENHKIRDSLELKLWNKSCMERDSRICQKTGISGGSLEVHHINNFSSFPELRTSIENGITLSKKAHRDFHNMYGYKNNTKEQLIEFLTANI